MISGLHKLTKKIFAKSTDQKTSLAAHDGSGQHRLPEDRKLKIAIGVVSNREYLNIEFYKSLFSLYKHTVQSYQVELIWMNSTEISMSRTMLVRQALDMEMDYLFSVDDDMVFPHNTITQLMAHKKDVVSGFYMSRKRPLGPGHYMELHEDNDSLNKIENRLAVKLGQGLVKLEAGGFGGMLLNLEIFRSRRLPEPWFRIIYDGKFHQGEDIFFFRRLKECGIQAYLDTDIPFGHLLNSAIFPDDYNGHKIKIFDETMQTRF